MQDFSNILCIFTYDNYRQKNNQETVKKQLLMMTMNSNLSLVSLLEQSNHQFGHLDLLKFLEYLNCYFRRRTSSLRGLLHQFWQQESKEGDIVFKREMEIDRQRNRKFAMRGGRANCVDLVRNVTDDLQNTC